MTFRHRAGVSPYTSSYDFAETCVFVKQSLGPFHCGPLELPTREGKVTLPGRPFSRSYGAILPSSLTRVLPIAWVFSTCPPVSVLVRARLSSLDGFLGGMASRTSPGWLGLPSQVDAPRISLRSALRGYPRTTIAWDPLAYPVTPSVIALGTWYRNINRLSIAYA